MIDAVVKAKIMLMLAGPRTRLCHGWAAPGFGLCPVHLFIGAGLYCVLMLTYDTPLSRAEYATSTNGTERMITHRARETRSWR